MAFAAVTAGTFAGIVSALIALLALAMPVASAIFLWWSVGTTVALALMLRQVFETAAGGYPATDEPA